MGPCRSPEEILNLSSMVSWNDGISFRPINEVVKLPIRSWRWSVDWLDTTTPGYECSYGVPRSFESLDYRDRMSAVGIAFDIANDMAAEGRIGSRSFHVNGVGRIFVTVRRK